MRTYVPKAHEVDRRWLVVDASDQVLGRLASEVAVLLRGKHKPTYTPHMDTGDFVVVVNAGRIRLTGRKIEQKKYFRHSGKPGTLHVETLRELLDRRPEKVIQAAVWGMLPKNRLGRRLLRKLKVYGGPEHPHQAQQPVTHTVPTR